MSKPFVFIGSSSEGIQVAKAIQANLDRICECQIWSQGLFGLSNGTLETLVDALTKFDFAILVLTADDLTLSRDKINSSPRDNVLFELGLFIGGLSKSRTFIFLDRTAELKLPSDLAGITPATFEHPKKGNMESAVGAGCYKIEQAINQLGFKSTNQKVEVKNEPILYGKLVKSVPDNDFSNGQVVITNYMKYNRLTTVTFQTLEEMHSRFTRTYLEELILKFPDHFRISRLGGKPAIALIIKY